jgi:hypothetical protein
VRNRCAQKESDWREQHRMIGSPNAGELNGELCKKVMAESNKSSGPLGEIQNLQI